MNIQIETITNGFLFIVRASNQPPVVTYFSSWEALKTAFNSIEVGKEPPSQTTATE